MPQLRRSLQIHAANYLFKRGAWLARPTRGRYVNGENFKARLLPDALAIDGASYLMELDDLSDKR
ncbi:MAG: hypothetical protein R3E67_06495 [Pseudomonadales bacterium]